MMKRMLRITMVLSCGLGMLLTLLWLITTAKAGPASGSLLLPNWKISQVDTASGGETSVAVDASGQVHMIYSSNPGLRYAVFSATTWITQVVDSGASVKVKSLSLDAAGNPHIAYVALSPQATTSYLRYAVLSGTNWITQTVEDDASIAGSSACNVSLALDDDGRPHVSYGAIPSLRYAVLTSTGWLTQAVDTSVYGTICTALDVEDSGTPHLAYYELNQDTYGGKLNYAVLDGTAWMIQMVDQGPMFALEFGLPSTLRLDSNGSPRILYYDAPNQRLKYAALGGTIWISETVPSPGVVDFTYRGSMALDSNDRPHISFAGAYGQDLIHAVLSGTQWLFQVVDDSLKAGSASSIVLDDEDNIYISYLDTYQYQVNLAQSWYPVARVFLPVAVKKH